jgi:hypothetical protein
MIESCGNGRDDGVRLGIDYADRAIVVGDVRIIVVLGEGAGRRHDHCGQKQRGCKREGYATVGAKNALIRLSHLLPLYRRISVLLKILGFSQKFPRGGIFFWKTVANEEH